MTRGSTLTGGLLGVLKPPGMTSHDVVAILRRRWQIKRIGHAGTLDPLAAGVLPVLCGSSARLADMVGGAGKRYRAQVLLGLSTDTADLAGQVLASQRGAAEEALGQAATVCLGLLDEALAGLVGEERQVPPAFSARRVGGRRLYQLAREGRVSARDLAQASRTIRVLAVRRIASGRLGWGSHSDWPSVTFDVSCSSGTYVRELAERLGARLGIPACLAYLLRTSAGGLDLRDCVTLEEILLPSVAPPEERFAAQWRQPAEAVGFLPAAVVDAEGARLVAHGTLLPKLHVLSWSAPPEGGGVDCGPPDEAPAPCAGWIRILDREGQLLALAVAHPGDQRVAGGTLPAALRPKRVFRSGVT